MALGVTGKPYRLLSEAEYEYAARAGSRTKYPWGDHIKLKGNAMANGRDSEWRGTQTVPVGSFPANAFGLYDMVGNVLVWTEDCWNESYRGAPADGSAWTSGDCTKRVVRGAHYDGDADYLRSAHRSGLWSRTGSLPTGIRVARTLSS
jgi:formylglycine-generating enzyme required for sulfatase activity